MDLDRRVAALELRQNAIDQNLSGFLSPTSIKEVMLSLASSRRYRVIPLAEMGDFGWTPATTHISLRPITSLTPPPPPVSELTRATRHGPSRAAAPRRVTTAEASPGTALSPGASGLPARARGAGASLWRSVFDAGSSHSPSATQCAAASGAPTVPRRVALLFATLPKLSRAGTTRLSGRHNVEGRLGRRT